MKKFIKNNIHKVFLLLSIIILAGCEKDFDEINTNPNVPGANAIPEDNLFFGLIRNIAYETHDETTAIISDLFGFAFPSGIAAYEIGTADKWGMLEEVKNANELLKITAEDGRKPNKVNHGVAKIIKVILYHRLVDLFGAVPYTEGGIGLEFPQPKYDSEEFIYKDLVKELDAAIAEINSGSTRVYEPGLDLVYNGDASKWKVFANSLKLRLGMRMRFVDAAAAKLIIAECINSNLMTSNSDAWAFKYIGSEGSNDSRLYSSYKPNRFVSELLMKELRDSKDPRKFVYGDPAGLNDDFYQGQINGLNVNLDDGAQSVYGSKIWKDRTFPASLMTYAEVCLLKAEAALVNIGGGNANEEFRKGIRASMEQWDVSEAAINTFLATPKATLVGSEEEQLKQISIQKWISLYTNGHEAYAEMRRTGYPMIAQRVANNEIERVDPYGDIVTISVGYIIGTTEGIIPSRVEYPASEKQLNPKNFKAAVSTYGDGLLDKIWWDVR